MYVCSDCGYRFSRLSAEFIDGEELCPECKSNFIRWKEKQR